MRQGRCMDSNHTTLTKLVSKIKSTLKLDSCSSTCEQRQNLRTYSSLILTDNPKDTSSRRSNLRVQLTESTTITQILSHVRLMIGPMHHSPVAVVCCEQLFLTMVRRTQRSVDDQAVRNSAEGSVPLDRRVETYSRCKGNRTTIERLGASLCSD
jgi:hypothetical protein